MIDHRSHRSRSARTRSAAARLLVSVAVLLTGLGWSASPAAAADPVRLSITPVGVPGSYFAITAAPGDQPRLTVQLGNGGAGAVRVRTFAADAYTINNGGFGARLDGEPTSGATTWLEYAPETFDLAAGASVQRSFVVSVPLDTQPGEYLAGLVLQNAEPVSTSASQGELGVAFRQVNRQVIAVSITVPGALVPRLEIGAVSHRTVAGTSSIAIAVRNVGNVRLTPVGELVLSDLSGSEISRFPIQMDSFYAGTETSIEVPYARRLNAGAYTASLTLAASAAGIDAAVSSGPLAVDVPTPAEEAGASPLPVGTGTVPQPAAVNQAPPGGGDSAHVSVPTIQPIPTVWLLGALALLLVSLGVGVGVGLIVRRQPHRGAE